MTRIDSKTHFNCRAGASPATYFGAATGAVALQQPAFIRVIRGNRTGTRPCIYHNMGKLGLREQVDSDKGKQEVGNKNRRSSIILGHSLTEK
jgi:hypothetical protein